MSSEVVTQPPAKAQELPKREVRVVEDNSQLSYMLDTARFEHLCRVARVMASGSMCPEHLRGKSPDEGMANCFRVVNQALRWGFDPFAVADATYFVYGKMGYEGKLVAAVINARAGLAGNLSAIYNGKKGDDMACVVYGSANPIPESALPLLEAYAETEDHKALNQLTFQGVKASRLTVGEAKTFTKDGKVNSPWLKNIAQKLFYSCATKWGRRWMPEIMLGVLTDDDVDRMIDARPAVEDLPTGRQSLRPIANGHKTEPTPAAEERTQERPEAPPTAGEQSPHTEPPPSTPGSESQGEGEASSPAAAEEPPRDALMITDDFMNDLPDRLAKCENADQAEAIRMEAVGLRKREIMGLAAFSRADAMCESRKKGLRSKPRKTAAGI